VCVCVCVCVCMTAKLHAHHRQIAFGFEADDLLARWQHLCLDEQLCLQQRYTRVHFYDELMCRLFIFYLRQNKRGC
jgi:hypothetical protein